MFCKKILQKKELKEHFQIDEEVSCLKNSYDKKFIFLGTTLGTVFILNGKNFDLIASAKNSAKSKITDIAV